MPLPKQALRTTLAARSAYCIQLTLLRLFAQDVMQRIFGDRSCFSQLMMLASALTAPSCVRYAFSHSFSPLSCTSNRVEVVDWSLNPVCGTALGFKPSAKARARGDVMQLVDTGDYTQQCGKMRPSILASRLLYSHSSLLRHQSKSALRPCLDLIVIVSWP